MPIITPKNQIRALSVADILQPHIECCICMGTLYNAVSCTPCLHSFCMGCICRCFEKNEGKCPVCRGSVKEISPNLVLRDLVKTFLELKPDMEKSEKDQEEADQAELEYSLKWLGSTDPRFLEIESLASLQGSPERGDNKYTAMLNRVTNLFYKQLSRKTKNAGEEQIPLDIVVKKLAEMLDKLRREALPANIFLKYHRLEEAYRKMVRISMPAIGPGEHSWVGNMFFEHDYAGYRDPKLPPIEDEEEEPHDLKLAEKIDELIFELRNPHLPSRKPEPTDQTAFDPIDLAALSRVQKMRYPGFYRQHEIVFDSDIRVERAISSNPMVTRRRSRLAATTSAPRPPPHTVHSNLEFPQPRRLPPRVVRQRPQQGTLARQEPPEQSNPQPNLDRPRRRSSRIAARNQALQV